VSDSQHGAKDAQQIGVEPDLLPLGSLTVWIGFLVALVIVIMIGIWQFFSRAADDEVHRKDLARVSETLRELRVRDHALLTSYDVVDAKAGVYRIPVERAMDLLVADPTLLEPAPPPPPATTDVAAAKPTGSNADTAKTSKEKP